MQNRMREHEHEWRKVPPFVVVVNDPLAAAKGGETYNARCAVCGVQAWLHWPSGSLAAAKPIGYSTRTRTASREPRSGLL